MSARRLTPMDAMFLYADSPNSMMHVAGLMPFEPQGDSGVRFLQGLEDELRAITAVESPWNLKLAHPKLKYSPLHSWVVDDNLDLDYHVRRSALPVPGGERELGTLVSRLHSNPLDLTRPPWELHVIEGLERGRWAMYFKLHHALLDGYSAMLKLINSLSPDPDAVEQPLIFQIPERTRRPRERASERRLPDVAAIATGVTAGVGSTVDLGKALLNVGFRSEGDYAHLVNSAQAPHSILNRAIGRNRRFATQQYSLPLLADLGRQRGATLNDVVLSVIGGGLRTFLGEMDELPTKPLIAFLPVNVRPQGDPGGGNSVGAILATLATDVEDPVERLDAITASTSIAKAQLEGLSQKAIVAYSVALLAPVGLQAASAVTGIKTPVPLAFNLCVSNVPGPREPLYLRGNRLEASYPVSIPTHGVALNITLHSYADTLSFGFVGCRDTLPHLQRLAVYTGEAVAQLEKRLAPTSAPNLKEQS